MRPVAGSFLMATFNLVEEPYAVPNVDFRDRLACCSQVDQVCGASGRPGDKRSEQQPSTRPTKQGQDSADDHAGRGGNVKPPFSPAKCSPCVRCFFEVGAPRPCRCGRRFRFLGISNEAQHVASVADATERECKYANPDKPLTRRPAESSSGRGARSGRAAISPMTDPPKSPRRMPGIRPQKSRTRTKDIVTSPHTKLPNTNAWNRLTSSPARRR